VLCRGSLMLGVVLPVLAASRPERDLVVLIAIDGLRPSELTSDATKEWNVPALRELLRDGAGATGVKGVVPTLTLPNMTTLVTGASPSDHGIVNNIRCGEENRDDGGYYWYARDVKVETLWDAAQRSGLTTVNVGWTTTIGRPIQYNLPEVWKAGYDLQASNSTAGLIDRIDPGAAHDSTYKMDDDRRAAYGKALIALYHPSLLTVFFENLDATEHRYGVDTPEDRASLEHIDHLVGELVGAARQQQPNATIVVVSDHGFVNAFTDINLTRAFAQAGVPSARVCGAGGSAYVLLPDTVSTSVLDQIRGNPDNGIEKILDRAAIRAAGGWTDAQYLVVFQHGFVAARNPSAPLRATSTYRGMHGYWPDSAMYATFIINGKDVPLKGDLGIVDMRDIAPTIARLLGTRLASARGKALF
jgi:predicted AlkP superfamily pyrophosphatase or phosphodiesterase